MCFFCLSGSLYLVFARVKQWERRCRISNGILVGFLMFLAFQ